MNAKRSLVRVWLLAVAVCWVPAGTVAQDLDEIVRERLRYRLESALGPATLSAEGERIQTSPSTGRFYEARIYAPAWTTDTSAIEDLRDLVETVSAAAAEGLDPHDYHAPLLATLLGSLDDEKDGVADAGIRVDLELLATDSFLLFASHCLAGHLDPMTIDPEWRANRRGADLVEVLERALTQHRIAPALRELLPPQPGYAALRDLLARYRRLAGTGDWPAVAAGPRLEAGSAGERVAALAARLRASGDLATAPAVAVTVVFDEALGEAVRRFQARHGLDSDGVVGPATLEALNVPLRERIRQIVVNLERWRWLPQDLGRRQLRVNIAAFELDAFDGNERDLRMKVIVGRDYRRTPVFSDAMTYVVFNPSWEVPPKLAVQDILPQVRKDPGYLERMGIRVLEGWGADEQVVEAAAVDWGGLAAGRFPYRFRQMPGPLNALGRVKFMFPNPFNVYLHDTPARELFARSNRALSSGCIRLERPLELAAWVLPDWDAERIHATVEAGIERTVRLPSPVAVHLLYWTAWIDDEGALQFRKDLYGRDARVAAAMREPPPGAESAGAPR